MLIEKRMVNGWEVVLYQTHSSGETLYFCEVGMVHKTDSYTAPALCWRYATHWAMNH